MLMPQMIDAINRQSVAAIQQLERHAAQVNKLQPLLETMSAVATDITPMPGGGFWLHVATPVYWQLHRNAPIWFKFTFAEQEEA